MRRFPFPLEAVAVLRQVTIERLIRQDGFETLEEWYNAMVKDADDNPKKRNVD